MVGVVHAAWLAIAGVVGAIGGGCLVLALKQRVWARAYREGSVDGVAWAERQRSLPSAARVHGCQVCASDCARCAAAENEFLSLLREVV